MTAYALIELEVIDTEKIGPYMAAVSETVASHGGKYLVRPGATEVVEGGPGEYPLKVVLAFPSMKAAKGWYNSDAYQAILPHRLASSKGNFLWVEGA